MDRNHRLDTSSSRPGNISGVYENDGLTMIVPPVSIMPLVPVTAERFVKADMILCVVPLFAVGVFRRFGLPPLRSGLWITVCDMPLRIYRRERLIVSPRTCGVHALFSLRVSVHAELHRGCSSARLRSRGVLHRRQCAEFIFTCRWIQNVSFPGNNAASLTHRAKVRNSVWRVAGSTVMGCCTDPPRCAFNVARPRLEVRTGGE